RTSTQQYQSKPGNLSEIAKQLGVANILEGSVQKAADQVRVNVQLIEVASDSHLWADTYDRKLVDIFAVESEMAKAIADALQAKLALRGKETMTKRFWSSRIFIFRGNQPTISKRGCLRRLVF